MVETFPFTRRAIEIGSRTYIVDVVDDQDALLAASGDRVIFPFGLMLWESAVGLGEELASRTPPIAGKTVLELGAGLGLSGVVAAALGAHVTQTDHDLSALAACIKTASLNNIPAIRCVPGDWHAWRDMSHYDLIIGADIAYDTDDHEALFVLFQRNLAPGGTILLADPGRENQALLLKRAEAHGWRVHRTQRPVADLKPARPGAAIAVTIMELTQARPAMAQGSFSNVRR